MTRQLYTGENLAVMQSLESDSVDLIYLDPPFNSNKDYGKFDDRWNADYILKETIIRSDLSDLFDVITKTHSTSMMAYVAFMSARLQECKRLLKDTGSIYLHVDPTASHYLKLVMDLIFGSSAFRNEIVWGYNKWSNAVNYFQRNHDCVLFYGMDNHQCNVPQVFSANKKRLFELGYHTNTVQGGLRQLIVYDRIKAQSKIAEGDYDKVVYTEKKGTPMSDTWTDINFLNSQAKERLGYPTQKPLKLLERIVQASSNFKDVVLDPFCGSGTTLLAAERFGCSWIGIDKNDNSELLESRAVTTFGELTFDYDHINLAG